MSALILIVVLAGLGAVAAGLAMWWRYIAYFERETNAEWRRHFNAAMAENAELKNRNTRLHEVITQMTESGDDPSVCTGPRLPRLHATPVTCPIRERTADGVSVGRCDYYLKDGNICERHGDVSAAVTMFAMTGKLSEDPRTHQKS